MSPFWAPRIFRQLLDICKYVGPCSCGCISVDHRDSVCERGVTTVKFHCFGTRQWRTVVTYSWRYLCAVPLTQLRNWKSSYVFPNLISTDQVYTKSEFLLQVRIYCLRQHNRWEGWTKFTRSLVVCRLHFRYSSCHLKVETLCLTSCSVIPSNFFKGLIF